MNFNFDYSPQTSTFFSFQDDTEDENIKGILRSTENIINEDNSKEYQLSYENYYPNIQLTKKSQSTNNYFPTFYPHYDNTEDDNLFILQCNELPLRQCSSTPATTPSYPVYQNIQSNDYAFTQRKPYLKLQIICLSDSLFQLDEPTITDIFNKYGQINKIFIQSKGQAFITFHELNDAIYAQKSLDGQTLTNYQIKIQVNWCQQQQCEMINYIMATEPQYNNKVVTFNRDSQKENHGDSKNMCANEQAQKPAKYTCRYAVQIDSDKEFQVARKIIGPKGCNMKKIVERCIVDKKKKDVSISDDVLKLRLRGRGSGFKEGPEKKESDEPLHLCISSKLQDVYIRACTLVEELLNNIYHEYKTYCFRLGKYFQPNLKAIKIESNQIKRCSSNNENTGTEIQQIKTMDNNNGNNYLKMMDRCNVQNNMSNQQINFQNQSNKGINQFYQPKLLNSDETCNGDYLFFNNNQWNML